MRSLAVLLAVLLAGWLLFAPPPDSRGTSTGPATIWVTSAPLLAAEPKVFPIAWTWEPDQEACAEGQCLPVAGGGPPAFPTVPRGEATRWDANLTLDGVARRGDLVPTVTLQAGHLQSPSNGTKGGCTDCGGFMAYRDIQSARGRFPIHLVRSGIALAPGETELRVTVTASPPPGAVGILGASTWRLDGHIDAIAPTPSG